MENHYLWITIKKLLLSLLLTVAIAGCATSPVKVADATPVPYSAILAPKYLTPTTERTEKVILVRDTGIYASGHSFQLTLYKTPIAIFEAGESLTIYLKPGIYIGSLDMLRGNWLISPSDFEIVVRENGLNNFRIRPVNGDGPRIDRSYQI